MDLLLREFVFKCKKSNVTPAENEIMCFLSTVNRVDLFEDWVKQCFYNWDELLKKAYEVN